MSTSGIQRLPTIDELKMIKKYMILPLVLANFERDKEAIAICPSVSIPDLYCELLQTAMDHVIRDLAMIKNEFRQRGIKVFEDLEDQDGARCRYLCRGHQSELFLMKGLLHTEIAQRMSYYLRHE